MGRVLRYIDYEISREMSETENSKTVKDTQWQTIKQLEPFYNLKYSNITHISFTLWHSQTFVAEL